MKPKLYIYNNVEALTDGFIDHLVGMVNMSGSEKFNIILSGGSTPKKVFDRISEKIFFCF